MPKNITEERLIKCPMVGPPGVNPMIPVLECLKCKNNTNRLVLSRAVLAGDTEEIKHIFCNLPVKREVIFLVRGAI